MTSSTTTSPIEINQTRNRIWGHWKSVSIEWMSVIISVTATVVAIISVVFSVAASAYTYSRIYAQEKQVEQLTESINVYRIRAAKLNAWLAAKGIPLKDVYGEEIEDE